MTAAGAVQSMHSMACAATMTRPVVLWIQCEGCLRPAEARQSLTVCGLVTPQRLRCQDLRQPVQQTRGRRGEPRRH